MHAWAPARSTTLVLLLLTTACFIRSDPPQTRFYLAASPGEVLELATALLRAQGYELAPSDPTQLMLVAEQAEVVRVSRQQPAGTVIQRQLVLQVEASGAGTALEVTVNVVLRRPSGERRNLDERSPESRRVRKQLIEALAREVDLAPLAPSSLERLGAREGLPPPCYPSSRPAPRLAR